MRYLFFLFLFIITPSFSSEEASSPILIKTIKDISLETIRWPLSLEEPLTQKKLEQILHVLLDLKDTKDIIEDFIKESPIPKKELFLFLLQEPHSQKTILKQNPELISLWINSKIRIKDLLYFEKLFDHWNLSNLIKVNFLDPETVILFMPHLFLSLADEQIIEDVFTTEGFNPYFTTGAGNNLLHSFLFLRLLHPFEEGVLTSINHLKNFHKKTKPSKKALQLLIDKSPPELLTQKNHGLLTPITFSIHLNHFFMYDLLIKALPPKSFINEIPFLEKAILYTGLYEFINPIHQFIHDTKPTNTPLLLITEQTGKVFLEIKKNKGFKQQASFMSLEPDVSIVTFDFNLLSSQNKFTPYIENLQIYKNHEIKRINKITEAYQDPNQKELIDLYKALFTRDIQALQTAYQKIIIHKSLQPDVLAQIILEESIRSQFEEGVLMSINHLKNIHIEVYGSLFFALLNYISLSDQHPRKKVAKNIAKHLTIAIKQKEGKLPILYISFATMFGITDMLEFFLKETDITLQDMALLSNYAEFSFHEEYRHITQLLIKKLEEHNIQCQDLFIH